MLCRLLFCFSGNWNAEGTKAMISRKIVVFQPLFHPSRRKKSLAFPAAFAYTESTSVGESGSKFHEVGQSVIFA